MRTWRWLPALLLGSVAAPLAAQPHATPPTISAGLSLQDGTFDTASGQLAYSGTVDRGPWSWKADVDWLVVRDLETDRDLSETFEAESFLRHRIGARGWLATLRTEVEHDDSAHIHRRETVGLGVGRNWSGTSHRILIEAGAAEVRQRDLDLDGSALPGQREETVWAHIELDWHFSATAYLATRLAVDEGREGTRLDLNPSFHVQLSRSFQLSIDYEVDDDSEPVPGAERSTGHFGILLGYRFRPKSPPAAPASPRSAGRPSPC